MALPNWARQFARGLDANSPTIMSGLAVAGVVTTAVLTARAAQKAQKVIAEIEAINESLLHDESEKTITIKDEAKATWKFYIPAVATGASTIALIIASNRVGVRQQAALAGAYGLLDTAFRNYKDEVLEQIGSKKEQAVRDGVAQKEMDRRPVQDNQIIFVGGGDQLCFESLSGRYFKSDIESIRQAANDYNRNIIQNIMYDTLNEWFNQLGLEQTDLGEILGFNVDRPVDLIFTAHLATNGDPCIAIGYKHHPFREFGQL